MPRFADDRWYPAGARELQQRVRSLLVSEERLRSVLGVVAPHAGYVYSGQVAGALYGSIHVPERVILLGPNHHGRGAKQAIQCRGEWRIPGYKIPIDEAAAERLCEEAPWLRDDAHAHEIEHSLELQLPFLVMRNPGVRVVPICLWQQSLEDCRRLGEALGRAIEGLPGDTLIVASSDMNHFDEASTGRRKDQLAIDEVLALKPDGLYRTVRSERISMCGMVATVCMLVACRGLGARQATLVKYMDSGDVSGDKSSVVGYAGIAVH